MSSKYPRLHERRIALQQDVWRNTEILNNRVWRDDTNKEFDSLNKGIDNARAEISELDDILDGNRLPISWGQMLQLIMLLVAAGIVLVVIVFTLGGR